MRKAVKNCRNLNMPTIKVRRGRPGSLAISVALLVTMLIVYLLTLQALSKDSSEASAALRSTAELRMEGMEAAFFVSSFHDDETQARISAAICARNGGAGMILREDERFAVIHSAGRISADGDSPVIRRNAEGLTLRLDAPADVISALSDGLNALHALASETAMLAESVEAGQSDLKSVSALLRIYQTQLEHSIAPLNESASAAAVLIRSALFKNCNRVGAALEALDSGQIRLVHAAACGDWIELAERLRKLAAQA